MDSSPLYEFGYSLSYTDFECGNLKIEPGTIGTGGIVRVSTDVRNKGDRPGAEVVQLYIHDVIGTVVTLVKELRGFEKIQLQPGEMKTVSFTVTPEHMALLNRHMEWVVEPGTFEIMIGHSSKDIRLKGAFEVASR